VQKSLSFPNKHLKLPCYVLGKMRGQNEVYHLPPIEEDDKGGKSSKIDSKSNIIRQTVEAKAIAGNIKTRAAKSRNNKTPHKKIKLPTTPVPQARLFETG